MRKIRKRLKIDKYVFFGILIGSIIMISALLISNITIISTSMLQSLIQAEATILGFFGIIVSYMLTSYDSRIDRLEQQRFDVRSSPDDLKKIGQFDFSFKDVIDEKIEYLKQLKKEIAKTEGLCVFFLILALISSIIMFGLQDFESPLSKNISALNLGFFFMGIVGIIIVFIQISYET
jgi:hypothetical protein